MERWFEMELREARGIICKWRDNPDEFKFKRAPRRPPHLLYTREYEVTVFRGKVPPATYKGGKGRNWIALFAQDLTRGRFSEGFSGPLNAMPCREASSRGA